MRRTKHSSDSRRYFDWMEIAARDLLAARLLLEQEQCLEIVGFHCQQCMEKAFKAYLIHASGTPVDGHNLTWLCRQAAKRAPVFQDWLEETARMNRLYIETRYPSDVELELDIPACRQIYATASAVYEAVSSLIYGEGEED